MRALHLDFPELAHLTPAAMLELASMLIFASRRTELYDAATMLDQAAEELYEQEEKEQ